MHRIYRIVKTHNINSKTHLKIINYLNQSGNIVGHRIINGKSIVPIVEFSDYSRIWMLPSELEILSHKTKLK